MTKNFPRTGKRARPKTAVKGKRFLCAKCRKRSPKRVKTPAPWYCPACLKEAEALAQATHTGILVRVKNTRTGRIVDVCPTPARMDLLAAFKPQAKAGTGHGPESKADDEHLAAVARKIAAMSDKDVASVR